MIDEVENMGHQRVTHMLLYHINLGFPFVDEGAQLVAPFSKKAASRIIAGETDQDHPDQPLTAPYPDAPLQVFQHFLEAEADHKVPLAMIHPRLNKGVYLIYNKAQMPVFLETRLMREGMYLVCLEPASHTFDRETTETARPGIWLAPGEKRIYELEIGILDGKDEVHSFEEKIAKITT
jgi:hypothetical protein